MYHNLLVLHIISQFESTAKLTIIARKDMIIVYMHCFLFWNTEHYCHHHTMYIYVHCTAVYIRTCMCASLLIMNRGGVTVHNSFGR